MKIGCCEVPKPIDPVLTLTSWVKGTSSFERIHPHGVFIHQQSSQNQYPLRPLHALRNQNPQTHHQRTLLLDRRSLPCRDCLDILRPRVVEEPSIRQQLQWRGRRTVRWTRLVPWFGDVALLFLPGRHLPSLALQVWQVCTRSWHFSGGFSLHPWL